MTFNGFLNIDKPKEWTSHDVVDSVRKIFKMQKVGHSGTLDPKATGVLPIGLGKATKLMDYMVRQDKSYLATIRLGEETETGDSASPVFRSSGHVDIGESEILEVLKRFTGVYDQVPPMYSAIKVGGVPLYKKARAGLIVDRKPRPVSIYEINLIQKIGRDLIVQVRCSKGTYIRTLSEDIGKALSVGAYLLELRRLRVGSFDIRHALTLEQLNQLQSEGRLDSALVLMEDVLPFPSLFVNASMANKVLCGNPIPLSEVVSQPIEIGDGDLYKVHHPGGELLALASIFFRHKENMNGPKEPFLKVKTVLKASLEDSLRSVSV